jgi:hypothetical protein
VGFIIGPVVAALFLTVWEIYGRAFADYLPEVVLPPLAGEIAAPDDEDSSGLPPQTGDEPE